MEQCDVAVVGAGLSGLVAARELVRAGVGPVLVLEARERVGGRTLSRPLAGGAVAEGGGQWIDRSQKAILDVIAGLGLATFPAHSEGETVYSFEGQISTEAADLLDEAERKDVERLVTEMERLAFQVPLDAPWRAPHASDLDASTVERWLEQNARTEAGRLEVELAVAASLSAPASRVSLLHWLYSLHAAGGYRAHEARSSGAPGLRVAGGAQQISLRIAAELGDRVRVRAAVEEIQQPRAGVRLLGPHVAVEARRVIVAMMPADARRLRFAPELPSARQLLHERWPAVAGFKVHVAYKEPFWRRSGKSGRAITDGLIEATFDDSPASGRPGVLLAVLSSREAPDDPDERREAVIEALAELFGDEASLCTDYVEHDWSRDPWSSGCTSPLGAGLWTRYGHALREPVGGVHWAGAETSPVWMGAMDGAVLAGQRAAAEVAAALLSRT